VTEFSREQLLTMLRAPDPVQRDDVAYIAMVQRIASGAEDPGLAALGDDMASRLADPEIQARTFAALILGEIVDRDRVTGAAGEPAVARWRDAYAAWYPAETDLRGYDERLGWLHAVAHGADVLAAFGRSPRMGREDLRGLLGVAAARLVAPARYVLRDQEDDRLGYALAQLLARAELDEADSTEWLGQIAAAFRNGTVGPVPPFASNAMRTLRALYLLCDRGFLPPEATQGESGAPVLTVAHPEVLKGALGGVLSLAWPYLA
jgi:hypothetical protein